MLIDFKVSNYRSFKNEQDFSMETGKRLSKYRDTNTMMLARERVLKSALVFGANANGKTNLIHALMTLKNLVITPTTDELQQLPTDTFGYNHQNTTFKIEFIQDQIRYRYHLEYNANEVVTESLTVGGHLIFNRKKQRVDVLPEQLVPLRENLRKNQLLLYFAQQNNQLDAKKAYQWFVEDLILVNTNRIQNVKFKALQDSTFKTRFLHFLQAADFNVVDVEVKARTEMVPNPQFIMQKLNGKNDETSAIDEAVPSTFYDVYCIHQSKNDRFSVYFNNESTGTQVFMFLALYILRNTQKTLLIDEFDRSYHLELAQALLSLINSHQQTNQFILTTHELSLMDNALRQDQIWFAEKNRFGESELFSLFDFDDPALKRSDFNYKKRYLEGRYGATQIVNRDLLLEALKK